MKHLKGAGIGTAIHYPVPLHIQKAYASLNYCAGDFPVAESVGGEIVSLPMYPQLTFAQQEKVASEVEAFNERQKQEPAEMKLAKLFATAPMM